MEFDYEIQYKKGKDNVVADALSRVEGSEILHMVMTVLECDLMQQIQSAYQENANTKKIMEELQVNSKAKKYYV